MIVGLIAFAALLGQDGAVAVPASAPSSTPAAVMRMIGSTHFDTRWHGIGEVRAAAKLCVTSTTGRFVLEVLPVHASGVKLSYDIVVTTLAGESQTQPAGLGPLQFTGTAVGSDCLGKSNVTVEIRFAQQELTRSVAGDYLEQIQLSVRPA